MEILVVIAFAVVVLAGASSLQVKSVLWMAVPPNKKWMRIRVLLPDAILYTPLVIAFSANWPPAACGIFASFVLIRLPIIYATYLASLKVDRMFTAGGPSDGEFAAMRERAKFLRAVGEKRYGSARNQQFLVGLSITLTQALISLLCIAVTAAAPLYTGICCCGAASVFAVFAYLIRITSN